MALFGSGKNQRPSQQYEQKRSSSRQQQRYQNEREMKEQRVRSRNRLIGSVILVLAAIIILPLILKTGDDSSNQTVTNAPLISPGSSIGQGELVVEHSSGTQRPSDSEEPGMTTQGAEEGLSIAEGGVLFEDDEETPLAVDESLPEGEDEAAFAGTSGLSIAESTAEQSAIEASEARERAEREAAAAAERKKQEQARAAAAKAEQQKQQQAAAANKKRTDDGSKALAILEGRAAQPSTSASAPATSNTGEFSLQVASYTNANDARTQRDRLRGSGISNAYIQSATVNGNQVFRLRVGPFSSREAAQAAQTRVRALNFSDSFVTGR